MTRSVILETHSVFNFGKTQFTYLFFCGYAFGAMSEELVPHLSPPL